MNQKSFQIDVQEIRQRARSSVSARQRARYPGDVHAVVSILNDALAAELVCALVFRRHHYVGMGIKAAAAVDFLPQAKVASHAADLLARRIVELGGEPDFSPNSLIDRSIAEYTTATELRQMLEDELSAERAVITRCRTAISFVNGDPTTRRILEKILAQKEAHAESLRSLLCDSRPSNPEHESDPASQFNNVVPFAPRGW